MAAKFLGKLVMTIWMILVAILFFAQFAAEFDTAFNIVTPMISETARSSADSKVAEGGRMGRDTAVCS